MKISIIIPTFNSEKYIGQCLNSIVNQHFENCEVIIVDGASQDNTLRIAESYHEFLNIQALSEPDSGQAEAVEKGLGLATGDIIHWHASDDLVLPGAFRRVEGVFSSSDVELVYSDGYAFDEYHLVRTAVSRFTSFWTAFLFMGRFQSDCAYWRASITAKGMPLSRQMLLNCDEDFFLRIWAGSKAKWLKEPLGAFRMRSGQISQTASSANLKRDRRKTREVVAETLGLGPCSIALYRIKYAALYVLRDKLGSKADAIYHGVLRRSETLKKKREIHRTLLTDHAAVTKRSNFSCRQ